MSTSNGDPSTIQPPAEPPERIPGMTLWSRLLAGAVIFLIAIWIFGWQEEAARWHWAAACELYYGSTTQPKDLPAALAQLDVASQYDPENVALHFERSKWRLEAKDFDGALADCELLQRIVPELGQREILIEKAETYRRMGKIRECIAELDKCVALVEKIYPGQRTSRDYQVDMALSLNARAYYRAVAGIELDAAWQDIQKALELVGETGDRPFTDDGKVRQFLGGSRPGAAKDWQELLSRMNYMSQMLDTRAYLHLMRDEPAAALADMNEAIAVSEGVFAIENSELVIEGRTRYDRRDIDRRQQSWRHLLATLYQHRGLAHEKLGHSYAASGDLRLAKELGYNPAEGVW